MNKKEYKELSSLAANGDAKAFSRLYETVYGAMYYTAFYPLASEADSIEVVLGTARDAFNTINRLHNEESFRVFILKTLCARIRTFFKDYGDTMNDRDYGSEIKNALFTLDNLDRMCVVMSIAAKFTPEEISFYSGMSKRAVKKRITRALNSAEILNHKDTRREMLHKVVPEDVLPQNIINLMIDETAEPPEPDAFTFLMRLRDLGIGSTDFLYLLEGCGAPESAVERIRSNPAMSLQGLILTLENSRLTGEDYTRMLYTARQIWERTLTMRLERTEQISEGEYPDEIDDVDESDEIADEEQFDEASFTEVFDKINGELCEPVGESAASEADEPAEQGFIEYEEQESAAEYEAAEPLAEQRGSFTETFGRITVEAAESVSNPVPAAEEEIPETAGESFTEAFDRVTEEVMGSAPSGYSGDTTMIVKIDPEQIREELARLTEGGEEEEYEDSPLPEEFEERAPSPYHKRALFIGAAGAAAVIACGVAAGMLFAPRGTVSYAADEREVFADIYDSYYAGVAGGENVCAFPDGNCEVFGDLLISSEGLGVFTDGNCIYDVGYEIISVNLFADGNLTVSEDLIPPENSRFVAAFDDNGALIAVFSGKQSGFMRIDDGKTQYIARQDGVLTDYRAENGKITLATVYTPTFTHSFTANDTNVYLPCFGLDEVKPIPAKNVILSGTAGYSYAVNAAYKTADGAVESSAAALGNPLFASADGCCVMIGDDGMILEMGDKPSFVKCGKATLAAFCENGSAILEDGTVYIRDRNGTVTAKVENLAEAPQSLRFSGDFLIISGKEKVILSLDCLDIKNPKTAELRAVQGKVSGDSAVVLESADSSVTLTRYASENGKPKAVANVTKNISGDTDSKPRVIANTVVFTEDSCIAAFDYFDGVSVVSQLELFGKEQKSLTLYDDKTGFAFAFVQNGKFYAVSSSGINDILK